MVEACKGRFGLQWLQAETSMIQPLYVVLSLSSPPPPHPVFLPLAASLHLILAPQSLLAWAFYFSGVTSWQLKEGVLIGSDICVFFFLPLAMKQFSTTRALGTRRGVNF